MRLVECILYPKIGIQNFTVIVWKFESWLLHALAFCNTELVCGRSGHINLWPFESSKAAVERLVSHLMSLFAVAMSLPVLLPAVLTRTFYCKLCPKLMKQTMKSRHVGPLLFRFHRLHRANERKLKVLLYSLNFFKATTFDAALENHCSSMRAILYPKLSKARGFSQKRSIVRDAQRVCMKPGGTKMSFKGGA